MALARFPYVRHRGLKHPGSVLTLAVTEDGKTLASGGKRPSPRADTWLIFAQAHKGPDFGKLATWLGFNVRATSAIAVPRWS